jgi:hypothetical protein
MPQTIAVIALNNIRYITLIFIILVVGCRTKDTKSQSISETDTSLVDDGEFDEGETGCLYDKSNKRPGDTYPFDKSDKIELVSYQTRRTNRSNDSLIQDGNFTVPNIRQRVRLNKVQSDTLFSILYNYKKIRQGDVEFVADCYNPRHSIVFYQAGRAFAFLEVCFQCNGTRQTRDLNFGEFCDEKWCALQKFFNATGADFGLIHEMCE